MVQTAVPLNSDLGLEMQLSIAYNCSIITMTHTHTHTKKKLMLHGLSLLGTNSQKILLSLRERPSSETVLKASQVKFPVSSSATLKMASILDTMKVPSSINTGDEPFPSSTCDARSIPDPDSPPVLLSSISSRKNLINGGGMPRAEHIIEMSSVLLRWNTSPSTGIAITGATV